MEYRIELKITLDGGEFYYKEVTVANTDKTMLLPLVKNAVLEMAKRCENALK